MRVLRKLHRLPDPLRHPLRPQLALKQIKCHHAGRALVLADGYKIWIPGPHMVIDDRTSRPRTRILDPLVQARVRLWKPGPHTSSRRLPGHRPIPLVPRCDLLLLWKNDVAFFEV